jgi:hypothetical protein
MERVRIEMCRADIDLGQLDMARVRHYRDLIRGGGTLAPIHLSADNVVMDGRPRIIALAAEGAPTVAAVRVDRAMLEADPGQAWIWSARASSRVLIDSCGRNSSVALLRPGAAVGLRVLGFGAE